MAKELKQKKNPLAIPAKLLAPIGGFLRDRLRRLERRRAEIDEDDPFSSGRSDNHASPDTSAAEQFGHARAEAMKRELDKKIVETRKAIAKVTKGSYGMCESCGKLIDTDRLVVYPEATLCVKCEAKREK